MQAEPAAKAERTPEPASEEGQRQETCVPAGPEHLSNARSHVQVWEHRGQMGVMVVTGFSCLLGSALISQGRGLAQPKIRVGSHCKSTLGFSRYWISSGSMFFFLIGRPQSLTPLILFLAPIYLLSRCPVEQYFTSEGCTNHQWRVERKPGYQ